MELGQVKQSEVHITTREPFESHQPRAVERIQQPPQPRPTIKEQRGQSWELALRVSDLLSDLHRAMEQLGSEDIQAPKRLLETARQTLSEMGNSGAALELKSIARTPANPYMKAVPSEIKKLALTLYGPHGLTQKLERLSEDDPPDTKSITSAISQFKDDLMAQSNGLIGMKLDVVA